MTVHGYTMPLDGGAMTFWKGLTMSKIQDVGRLALLFLLMTGLWAGASHGQASMTLVDGPRTSFGLGTVWVWQAEDGTISTRGAIPQLLEQERVILSVQGSKKKKGKKPKLTAIGSVSGGVELNGTMDAAMPVHVRLNYNKGDRIQTAPLARTFEVDELLPTGQAVVVTFRLVGQERVEGERTEMDCQHILSFFQLGDGDACILAE